MGWKLPFFTCDLTLSNAYGYSSSSHLYCCACDAQKRCSGYRSSRSHWLDQLRAILRLVSAHGQSQQVSIWQWPMPVMSA